MAGSIDDEVVDYEACVLPYSHAASYAQLGGTRVVAAADIDQRKLGTFRERWKVPSGYLDYREMIERENLDILSVTTPAPYHSEIVIFAAEKGVSGIYCEKAMCCSLAEADRMVEACERNHVKFNLGTQRRFSPGYQAMKGLIEGGKIGEPRVAISYSVGALMHTHSHSVDTIRFLLGDPKLQRVRGDVSGSEYDRTKNAYDKDPALTMGHVSFSGDKQAFLVPSPSMYEFEVDCTEGAVRVLDNGIEWQLRVMKDIPNRWRLHRQSTFPSFERVSPTVRCIEDLILAMESGSETRANPHVARDGMEICIGIAQSHTRGGSTVFSPIDERGLYVPSH